MSAKNLTMLGICTVAIIGLALAIHKLDSFLNEGGSPALEVTLDSEHGVLCWTNTHHSGMSCLPEWMLLPGGYSSIPNISSANIEPQLNGQKDPASP